MDYSLRTDLYACIANERVVLLDLVNDRYFALPAPADAAMQDWLNGRVTEPTAFTSLVERGFLIPTPNLNSHPPIPTKPARFDRALEQQTIGCLPPLAPILAQLQTKRALKLRSLHHLIAEIRTRKAGNRDRSLPGNHPTAERAVTRYAASRRFISAQDECLRWSIAMVRYLGQRHFYPDLVLGVRMMPFAAHAWVQDGETVLSDTAEYVSAYTPILVV